MAVRAAVAALIMSTCGWSVCGAITDVFPEDLRVSMHRFDLKSNLGYGSNILRSQDVHPRLSADGKRLYFLANVGRARAPWEVVYSEESSPRFQQVTDNERNEVAVVPSPVGEKLLLLVEREDTTALIVACGNTDQAEVATGLDREGSQLAWSHDGTFAYYSLPAENGAGLGLRRVAAGGAMTSVNETIETLFDDGVSAFDACATRDRLAVVVGGVLEILDDGTRVGSLATEGKTDGLRLSRDGRLAAWSDGKRIVVVDLERGETVVTSSPPDDASVADRHPAWSPDGRRLVFQREYRRADVANLVFRTALVFLTVEDGAEQVERQTDSVRCRLQWAATGDPIVFDEMPLDAIGARGPVALTPSELKPKPPQVAWQRTNGPYGGSEILAFAVAPSNDKVLYANVAREGFYASTDGGESWNEIMCRNLVHKDDVRHLVVDPADARTLFAAAYISVYRSTDGAETWQRYTEQKNPHRIDQLVVHPSKSGVLFALCDKKRRILRVADGKWEALIEFDDVHIERLSVDPRNHDLLIVYGRNRVVMFSPDGGLTYHEPRPPQGEEGFVCLAGSADDADLLLAMTASRRTFSSTDLGRTWDVYVDPANPERWTDEIQQEVAQAFPLLVRGEEDGGGLERMDTAEHPRARYEVRGALVYRSDDGGRTWTSASRGLGHCTVGAVQPLLGTPKGLLMSVHGSLLSSADGGESWQPVELPPEHGSVRILAAHPHIGGVLFACDDCTNVFRSADAGATWAPVIQGETVGLGSSFQFDAGNPERVTYSGGRGVLESADGGVHWKRTAEFEQPLISQEIHTVFLVANAEAITFGMKGRRRVFQTRDGGRTWHQVEGPMRGRRVVSMIGRPGVPGALYILTNEMGCDVLWVSDDFGETWHARPLPASKDQSYSLARSPADPDMLAVGIGNQVWLSRDDGHTWQDLGGFTAKRPFSQLAFSPADGRLYVVILWDGLIWARLPAAE